MVAAFIVAFVSYAPAHLARGICSGSGRFRAYAIVMGSRRHRAHRAVRPAVRRRRRRGRAVRLRRRPRRRCSASPTSLRRGHLRTEPGPDASWTRSRRTSAGCSSGRCSPPPCSTPGRCSRRCSLPARPTDARTPRSPSSPTACCSPASRCSCSRPCRPRCSPASAGSPRRATSPSSAPGCDGCCMLVHGRRGRRQPRRAGRSARSCSSTVYDAELSGTTLAMLAAGSACYMLALALAQAVIALKGHSWSPSAGSSAAVGLVLGTWLGSDDVFRRVEIGLLVSSVAAVVFFALALRYRLRSGVRPDDVERASKRSPTCPSSPEAVRRRTRATVQRQGDAGLGGLGAQVVVDHHLDQRREVDLGRPAERSRGLGRRRRSAGRPRPGGRTSGPGARTARQSSMPDLGERPLDELLAPSGSRRWRST